MRFGIRQQQTARPDPVLAAMADLPGERVSRHR
jgi:hypothetical protein